MDSIPIPVEFCCGNCGEKALLAEVDTLTDDSIVSCTACGANVGRWGDVKQQTLDLSAEELKKRLKDLL